MNKYYFSIFTYSLISLFNYVIPIEVKAQSLTYNCYIINEYGEIRNLSNICGFRNTNQNNLPSVLPDKTNVQKPPLESPPPETQPETQQINQTTNNQNEVDKSKLPAVQRAIPLLQEQRNPTNNTNSTNNTN